MDRRGEVCSDSRSRDVERQEHLSWEIGLPTMNEMTPINKSLISPVLACAFSIEDKSEGKECSESEAEKAAQATLHNLYESIRHEGGAGKRSFQNTPPSTSYQQSFSNRMPSSNDAYSYYHSKGQREASRNPPAGTFSPSVEPWRGSSSGFRPAVPSSKEPARPFHPDASTSFRSDSGSGGPGKRGEWKESREADTRREEHPSSSSAVPPLASASAALPPALPSHPSASAIPSEMDSRRETTLSLRDNRGYFREDHEEQEGKDGKRSSGSQEETMGERNNNGSSNSKEYGGGKKEGEEKGGSTGTGSNSAGKKSKRNSDGEDEQDESADVNGEEHQPKTLKRPRLVWTPQLHKRFVDAVGHLGIKNAVPKTIMQLMNVEGLTRENVASHLQKYRLYLKRMQGLGSDGPMPSDPLFDPLFSSTPIPSSLVNSSHGYFQRPMHHDDVSQGNVLQASMFPGHQSGFNHGRNESAMPNSSVPYVSSQYSKYGYSGSMQQQQQGSKSSYGEHDFREQPVRRPRSPPQTILSLFPGSGN